MIFKKLTYQLNLLCDLLGKLTNEQYQQKIHHLSNASIGGHTRHIIELLQCSITGHYTGEVDYINRKRNLALENSTNAAISELQMLIEDVCLDDKQLLIAVEQTEDAGKLTVFTTYFREIVYNIEHTVHHLALIKVALVEMRLDIVNSNFGMADSTLKYRATLRHSEV